jgi:uncharacterized membrane protein
MRQILKNVTVYSLGLFYLIVGIKHFANLDFFLTIVPPYIPFPELMVYTSGILEILFGFLLIPKNTRKYAALGLIILLIAVFPANIYLFKSDIAQNIYNITRQQALIRLPFQIPLILIAFWHSKEKTSKEFDQLCIILFIPTILYFLSLGL